MDDDPTQLLAMLQQDPDAARQLVESQLAQQAAENPTMALLLQLMSTRRAMDSTEPAPDDRADTSDHAHALRAELARAHDLLDDLAAALGACAACWGADESCRACRGRGSPGWRIPDHALFDEIVAPAVKRRSRTHHAQGRDE